MAEDFGKIGAAHVEIKGDLSPLQQSLRKAETDTRSWVGRLKSTRVEFGAILGLGAAGGIAAGLFKASKEAGNFAEQFSQAQNLFGAGADAVATDVDRMAESLKVSKTEAIAAANRLGTFALAAGQSGEQAGRFAMQMVRLADDMASFKDMSFSEAIDKVSAGLAGESEPLRRVGILMNEHAVAQEAVRLGLAKTTTAVDDQAKVMGRASLIQAGMTKGTGDHERTLGSYNNQLKALQGNWSNLMEGLGEAVVPAANKMVGWLNQVVETAQYVGRNFEDLWSLAGIAVAETIDTMAAKFQWLGDSVVSIGQWIHDNWSNIMADLGNITGTILGNVAQNFITVGQTIGTIISAMREEIGQLAAVGSMLTGNGAAMGGRIGGDKNALMKFLTGGAGDLGMEAGGKAAGGMSSILDRLSAEIPDLADKFRGLYEGMKPLQTGGLDLPGFKGPDYSGARDEALQRISDREEARKARLSGGAEKADLTTGGAGARAGKEKAGRSEVIDFLEMTRKIQQGILGGDSAKETANNTARMASGMEKVVQNTQKMAQGGVPAVAGP